MRIGWKWAGLAAGLVVGAPGAASAHLLECEKTVNGETLLELGTFPATLEYRLTVRNIHPTSASEVLEASDPFLESRGFDGFDTPFTLAFEDEETKTFDEIVLDDYEDCLELAGRDGKEDEYIDNVFTVRWDSSSDICTATVKCVPPDAEDGRRMTGGGSVFGRGQDRVTHGFQLRCDAEDEPQSLEVNWQGNSFHLLDLTAAECTDDPALDEENPEAGFDTFVGEGTGRYNGVEGATIEFTFTDDGEPGTDDTACMVIKDASGATVLDVCDDLNFGNHQAHP